MGYMFPTKEESEERITNWANRWKPGTPIPYPEFITDLRAVLDVSELRKQDLKTASWELQKYKNGGPS